MAESGNFNNTLQILYKPIPKSHSHFIFFGIFFIFKKFINICIESKPGEVILKDELHHIEENEEKNIDEKIKEIEDEEKKEFFKGDL